VTGSRLRVATDTADLARQAAAWIVEAVRHHVAARGAASVALAGGSTPRPAYEALGRGSLAEALPWPRIDWYFGDERAVPLDDAESNYRLARESLFRERPESLERLHRMPADAVDAALAAREYGRLLPDPVDLMVLGMGEDGHTASLFPGSPALEARDDRVVPVVGPKPPHRRMTVTPPVIEAARDLLVLVAGEAKAETLARVLNGPLDVRSLPAQLARRGTWIVDRVAASRL
jgi:6-phosphogluconolactonase